MAKKQEWTHTKQDNEKITRNGINYILLITCLISDILIPKSGTVAPAKLQLIFSNFLLKDYPVNWFLPTASAVVQVPCRPATED